MNEDNQILTEAILKEKTKCSDLNKIDRFNLWGAGFKDVTILNNVPNLKYILLSSNKISSLKSFETMQNLEELYLRDNLINDFSQIKHLENLKKLRVLWLIGNPIAKEVDYRKKVLKVLPNLYKLDDKNVSVEEREEAKILPSPPNPKDFYKNDGKDGGDDKSVGNFVEKVQSPERDPQPLSNKPVPEDLGMISDVSGIIDLDNLKSHNNTKILNQKKENTDPRNPGSNDGRIRANAANVIKPGTKWKKKISGEKKVNKWALRKQKTEGNPYIEEMDKLVDDPKYKNEMDNRQDEPRQYQRPNRIDRRKNSDSSDEEPNTCMDRSNISQPHYVFPSMYHNPQETNRMRPEYQASLILVDSLCKEDLKTILTWIKLELDKK